MNPARMLLGRVIPEPFKEPYRRIRERLYVKLYESLGLRWTLKSGVTFTIRSASDWMMFCDIFLDGEYDKPIQRALCANEASGALRVLDLGANSGFFTFRLADRAQQAAFPGSIHIVAVEGSPRNSRRFETNLREAGLPAGIQVRTVHGLVGERSGTGHILESYSWGMSRVDRSGTAVPYVNLSPLIAEWPRVDLVKCDIEGSEYEFLSVYEDVLRKTCLAVFEFHVAASERIQECRRFLDSYGLVHNEVLRTCGVNTVELFWR